MAAAEHRALLIGNSTFPADPHNLQDLKGPVNDIARLHYALTDAQTGLFGADNVRLLPERSMSQILLALEQFFSKAGKNDRLLLYYSGHGLLANTGQLLLAANDTRTDSLLATTVSSTAINTMIDDSAAMTTMIVLDCCYSGAFKSADLPRSLEGSGRYVLSSTRSSELANDADALTGTSTFTTHLIKGLLSDAPDHDGDGFVDLDDLYGYVHDRLTEATGETPRQIPQRKFDGGGDVRIARRMPVVTTPKPVPAPPGPVTKGLPVQEQPPRLEVSDDLIEVHDVHPDEVLPPEWVAVLNRGGGQLDWYPVAEADWLTATPDGDYVRIGMRPRPGTNRGTVMVRDRGRGGSKAIRVRAFVQERPSRPPPPPPPPTRPAPRVPLPPAPPRRPPPPWWRSHLKQLAAGVVALLAAAVAAFLLSSRDDAGGTASTDVVVDGTQFWTDTGLDLAGGDDVTVTADGEVFHNEVESVGPEGVPNGLVNPLPDADHSALIGRIGDDGPLFYVGPSATFTVEEDGRLFLGINDAGLDNNRGSFTATVDVVPGAGD